MADVSRCLRDGYSSGNTPGTGFGAVQRLSTDFSVFSVAGKGTVILSRVRVPDGAASTGGEGARALCVRRDLPCRAGEVVSGDAWEITDRRRQGARRPGGRPGPRGRTRPRPPKRRWRRSGARRGLPAAVLEQAHPTMRSTRGAAMAVARIDATAGTLDFAGAGNIAGRMISGVEDRSLMSQHGTLGLQIRKIQDVDYAWSHARADHPAFGRTDVALELGEATGLIQCDPAVVAGWLVREHTRGRDDVTVVVVRRA
jgi:hypothetical protein